MFTSILIATGGAFVATVAVGTVSAVITRIRNNRKNKVTTEPDPEPIPQLLRMPLLLIFQPKGFFFLR